MTVPFLKSNTHIVDLSGISIWHPVRWNYQNHENFSAFSPRYSDWVATGYTMTVTVNAKRYIIYLIGKCIIFTCSRLSLTMVGQLWRDTNIVPFLKSYTHIDALSGISIWRHVRWYFQIHENFFCFVSQITLGCYRLHNDCECNEIHHLSHWWMYILYL